MNPSKAAIEKCLSIVESQYQWLEAQHATLQAHAQALAGALEYWVEHIAIHDPKYSAWLGKARAALDAARKAGVVK